MGFSQEKLMELDMDLQDCLIVRWFIDFKDTDKMYSETAENGNDYLCLKGSKIEFWVDFGIKRQVNEVKFHLYVAETKNLILPSILVEGSENGYEFYPLGQKRFSVTFNDL